MNYEKLTAQQALRIAELEEKLDDREKRLNTITLICVCIGGPLNDNKLKYTNAQLVNFHRIRVAAGGFGGKQRREQIIGGTLTECDIK